MFASRSSRPILQPLLERYASAYHVRGPEREALIEQTLAYIANDPDVMLIEPVERAIAVAMAQIREANFIARAAPVETTLAR